MNSSCWSVAAHRVLCKGHRVHGLLLAHWRPVNARPWAQCCAHNKDEEGASAAAALMQRATHDWKSQEFTIQGKKHSEALCWSSTANLDPSNKKELESKFYLSFRISLFDSKKSCRDDSNLFVSMMSNSQSQFTKVVFYLLCVQLFFVLALLAVESSSEIFVRLPQQLVYGSTPQFISTRKADQDWNRCCTKSVNFIIRIFNLILRLQKHYSSLQDSVVLIFPGAAGPDSSTQLLKDRIQKSDEKNGI